MMFLGVPVAIAMGIPSIIILLTSGASTPVAIAQKVVLGLDSFTMLAIPFFMVSSALMCSTSVGERIFKFAGTVVRHLPGGLAHVNIVSSMILAGMSGSNVADVGGIGKLEMEAMTKAGFDRPFSAGCTAASSTIAALIPPSNAMVIYGTLAGVSIGKLLMGGLLPGVLMGAAMMAVSWILAKKRGYPVEPRATPREVGRNFIGAFPALMAPVLLIGGILGGIFSPTEAASFCCVYAILICFLVYREMNFKQLIKSLEGASVFVCSILFIIANAAVFGMVLTYTQIPTAICNFFINLTSNKYVLLVLVNIMLLILGSVMEGITIFTLLSSVLAALAAQFGIDPVHFGVMVVLNLTIGVITPPVGVCLFLTQKIAGITTAEMIKGITPFLIVLIITLLLVTYIPAISTFLPSLL